MNNREKVKINYAPFLIALLAFLLMTFSSTLFIGEQRGEWEKDIRSNLLETLTANKSRLEKALYSRIYYTKGIAAYVSLHPELNNSDFQNLAKLLIKDDRVINTMSLSPNGIIRSIFPEKDHEAAIGLNLMEHPERKEIVEKTIETHQTFIAGPVELVEGGIAFISYTPIFDKTKKDEPFWGITDIVIHRDLLFEDAQLHPLFHDFEFALKGTDGKGNKGDIFWGNPDVFNKNPVLTTIDLPTGSWILAAAPKQGWNKYINQDNLLLYILLISSLIISILFWLFVRALIKMKNSEKELLATLQSMDSLIIEFSQDGKYLKIPTTNPRLLFRPKDQLIGQSVFYIFNQEIATLFYNSIQQCLTENKLVVIEYPLEIEGKETWFMARLSKKSASSVIYNAYDITEKKKSEKKIQESENRLKELNNMKDKFFSVIAHDLKTPVGNFISLSNFLNDEFDKLDDKRKKEILNLLQQTGSEAYELLNNLLNWALSQQNLIHIEKKPLALRNLCEKTIKTMLPPASGKKINIVNNIDQQTSVTGDENLTKTIIRNLISNAVKFSFDGGEIKLETEKRTINNHPFLLLMVSDNGIGMNEETKDKLFKQKLSKSNQGTKNEKGTGLGLILCKEFIEKQGGFISIDSYPGKGSLFTIAFPE